MESDCISDTITLRELAMKMGVSKETIRRNLPTRRIQMGKGANSKLLYDRKEALVFLESMAKEDK